MPSVYSVSREQFEQRMRTRRAATCLSVARSEIANGKMVEAIDRLEEACTLDPSLVEARLLLEELRSQEPAERPTAEVRVRRSEMAGWSHWVAAAIAICALATLAFLWPSGPSRQDGSVEPTREAPSASPANEPLPAATGTVPDPGLMAENQLQAPDGVPSTIGTGGSTDARAAAAPDTGAVAIKVTRQPVVQRPLPIVSASQPAAGQAQSPDAVGDRRSGAQDAVSTAPPSPPSRGPDSPSNAAPATVAPSPAPVPPAAEPRPAPPLPPLQRVPVVDETLVKPVATPDPEMATAPVPQGNDVPAEASLLQAPTDTGAIEGTLRRYADAYARLDAAAARAVWPTVDQRALARAFEGLESQGIVFEHCDVAVAGDAATAACNGRARYVPKVGSREPLVERRQWTFRLRKADSGWQITRAEAR